MSYVQTKTHNNDFSTTPADILTFATFQPLSTTKKNGASNKFGRYKTLHSQS